ncbi:MAG: M67 family metallopeptidase [Alkalinema sp. RU_4_3]|nr:M67 family metallopeptidase [Alkalinema sp. RU_4_3]
MSLLKVMIDHAEAEYPRECCGLILGVGDRIETIEPMQNVWSGEVEHSLRDRYAIDPGEMLGVMKRSRDQGLDIIGIYHSHPDHPALPSECDRAAAWPQYRYVILSVERGKVVDWRVWVLEGEVFVAIDFGDFKNETTRL